MKDLAGLANGDVQKLMSARCNYDSICISIDFDFLRSANRQTVGAGKGLQNYAELFRQRTEECKKLYAGFYQRDVLLGGIYQRFL